MKRWPRIENGVLSGLHSPVVTLQSGLSDFVLEPYIHTGPYEWRGDRLENTGGVPHYLRNCEESFNESAVRICSSKKNKFVHTLHCFHYYRICSK